MKTLMMTSLFALSLAAVPALVGAPSPAFTTPGQVLAETESDQRGAAFAETESDQRGAAFAETESDQRGAAFAETESDQRGAAFA